MMRKNILKICVGLSLVCGVIASAQNVSNWVAVDALGRSVPTADQVGATRPAKLVGVFYYLWQGDHGNRVYDITKIMAQYPAAPLSPNNPGWGPQNAFHWWGESEHGYFRATDPWVLRRDMVMLSNAGVDFLFLDFTNAVIYTDEVDSLCAVLDDLSATGVATPKISYMTNSFSGRTANNLYDQFYAPQKCRDHWFLWQGKPLILGKINDGELRTEVRNFFTWRYSWAVTATTTNPHHWQWLDATPQRWGWDTDPVVPEQVSVSMAFHPENPHGQSYAARVQPSVDEHYMTPYTGQGRFAAEQWERALQIDPQVIMITQWNEWLAQRFAWDGRRDHYAGRPMQNGWSFFVDVLNEEFNRDIAPMKGGHTDNNYYQMLSNIRRFKGMTPRQAASGVRSVLADDAFADWNGVLPIFWDPKGDTKHRKHPSYDPRDTLVNTTGRNDIVESRVAHHPQQVSFYAKTALALTPSVGSRWMMLFLDLDRNRVTGWQGFDWRINRQVLSGHRTVVEQWNGSAWVARDTVVFGVAGNQLEIVLSRKLLGLTGAKLDFEFQWADNIQSDTDLATFFTDGDVAPDRRFRFWFEANSPYAASINHWEFANDLQGWKGLHHLDSVSSGSCVELSLTGNDPYLHSPDWLGIDATELHHVVLHFDNRTQATQGELLWITESDGNYGGSKKSVFLIQPGEQEVVIDLSGVAAWQGKIRQLRWDPTTTVNTGRVCLQRMRVTAPRTNAVVLPGVLQFENFDLGGQGNAYHDVDAVDQGGMGVSGEGVDVQVAQDNRGILNVGWVATGEWLHYLIDVQDSGDYVLKWRVASSTNGNQVKTRFGANGTESSLSIEGTGGVQVWTTLLDTVTLVKGIQTLRVDIVQSGGGFNLNQLSVEALVPEPPTAGRLRELGLSKNMPLRWFDLLGRSAR